MKIQLTPAQIEASATLSAALAAFGFGFNYSETGVGKTVQSIHEMIASGCTLASIVTNKSVKRNWMTELSRYYSQIYDSDGEVIRTNEDECDGKKICVYRLETYQNVSGRKNQDETFGGALLRFDTPKYDADGDLKVDKDGNPLLETSFKLGEEMTELIESGQFMFIFDESQMAKNDNSRAKALNCLVTNAIQHKNKVLFLSGTPIDDPKQIVNVLYILGLIDMDFKQVRSRDYSMYVDYCHNLLTLCNKIDADLTSSILAEFAYLTFSTHDFKDMVRKLFLEVVIPVTSVRVHKTEEDSRANISNTYFTLGKNSGYQKALKKLEKLDNEATAEGRKLNATEAVSILQEMEWSKVNVVCKHAFNTLSYPEPGKIPKIVIGHWFIKTGEMLMEKFEGLDPLQITSDMNEDERQYVIDTFNRNDDKCQVLITSIECSQTGISLHDRSGKKQGEGYCPRTMYLFPGWKFNVCAQMADRVVRHGASSVPTIHWVFAWDGENKEMYEIEQDILTRLAYRSGVLRSVIDNSSNVGEDFKDFPGENLNTYVRNDDFVKFERLWSAVTKIQKKFKKSPNDEENMDMWTSWKEHQPHLEQFFRGETWASTMM